MSIRVAFDACAAEAHFWHNGDVARSEFSRLFSVAVTSLMQRRLIRECKCKRIRTCLTLVEESLSGSVFIFV